MIMPTTEITTKIGCRNACVYCPQDKLINAYRIRNGDLLMSLETFKVCIDKIPLNVEIEFSGMAEPWLNPDCTKMVLYAHQKGYRISVYTTLVGMTLKDVDLLKGVPFSRFWLHLPSIGGEEQIKADDNYFLVLKRVYDFLQPRKNEIDVSYHYRGEEPHPRLKEILGEDLKRKKLSTRASNVRVKGVDVPSRKKGIISCKRNLRHNVLFPNGDVALCCMDYGLQHIIGNLLKSDYASLFKSDEFLKVQNGLRDESLDILCRYCDMFALEVNYKSKIKGFLKNLGGRI
jgi:hypothetical protein